MSPKVGIVIVSHNASQAVRITLASLRQANNETSSKVILVDNASYEIEREKITLAFERHTRETSLSWEHLQQDKNMGFSGGNNIGIRRLLDDPTISHICLLNSDVIVTDHWLDRLIKKQCDIISAVTNKAESEQCIPVDYSLTLDECLNDQTETLHNTALSRVNSFVEDWHRAWIDHLVEGEATFFCVLIKREVLENLGLLDETFFPGGYEDEDFCLRARHYGYKVYLARDVFIHHWGSASFGQLQYEYFKDNASRNLSYLENKHGIIRHRRPEKPFNSFLLDVKFASGNKSDSLLRRRFHALYVSQLSALLKHFESEFKNLHQLVKASDLEMPSDLRAKIERATSFQNLTASWKLIISETEQVFMSHNLKQRKLQEIITSLENIIEGVWVRVDCNFAMHAFLLASRMQTGNKTNIKPNLLLSSGLRRVKRLFHLFVKGLHFFWNLQGIVFFGGYPYPERQSDGYFQRIHMVDHLFADRWRIYIEHSGLPTRNEWIDRPEPMVLVLRIGGRFYHRLIAQFLAVLLILRCKRIYFHSILTMNNKRIGWILRIPGLTKVIDIHGVVTEEFRLNNDFHNAIAYERVERLAVSKCDLIVVVSKSMESYLRQKYREELRGRIVLFPMFPSYPVNIDSRPYINGKPVIVYAGGLQKWQQVPKMISTIAYTSTLYDYRLYCPDPSTLQKMLPEKIHSKVLVDHKSRAELANLYPQCHYGFILREDNIVNHAACPTKLVEYLAMGIVPVVNSENIGDFQELGMQSVPLDALLRNSLPNEAQRSEMVTLNLAVYKRLHRRYKQGSHDLRRMLLDKSLIWKEHPLLKWAKDLLPPYSLLGRITRQLWMSMKTMFRIFTRSRKTVDPSITSLPKYDIAIQVGNFEAGGLENIALDINELLVKAGYKIILVVLGRSGAGVEKAREQGITVLVGSPEKEWYQSVINQVQPKLVLSHYSTYGIELYHKLGIPVVQVIQSIYMWFDEKQLVAFKNAAELTTAFIALSEAAKEYSVHRLGINKDSCLVLPCGIDYKSFDRLDMAAARQELRALYGFSEKDFVFLSVGAINHQKNHIATVRAFALQAAKLPHAKLMILGPAYEKDLLKEIMNFVETQQLHGRVIYAGSTSTAQKYYALADAFVSSAFFEGGPLNLLEAIKINLPIIMTNVGLARHFQGFRGINIIEPPVDVLNFHGPIWQLASTAEFEEKLATHMLNVYLSPERPDFRSDILKVFDKHYAYQLYVKLIEDLLQGKHVQDRESDPTWVSLLEEAHR